MKSVLNRKLLVLCLFTALSIMNPTQSHSMPAAPHFLDLKQSDGSTFVARQWGDEHSHGWETKTGHTIVFDQKIKNWTYAIRDNDGKLVSSSVRVNKSDPPPADLQKNLRPLRSSQIRVIGRQSSSASPSSSQLAAPVTGTKSLPVILIGFPDASFTKTKADFDNLLFGSTGNSMNKYYQENSYGQFFVNGGASGVYGPVTANNTRTYYGGNNASGDDPYPGTLVYEAVSKAAAGGFKFASFVDQSKSCYVDAIVIAHQGTGEEAGFDANDIWSHSWDLNNAEYYGNSSHGEFVTNEPCSLGGFIKVNNYVIQPELATPNPNGKLIGVGVFAHEYGHVLGLPDLYDTDNSSEGAGNWTLMAGGAWLGPLTPFVWNGNNYQEIIGDVPSHLDPWSKYYLGWINPASVAGNNLNQPVAAASSTSPNFYRFGTGTPTSGEYFLVENRQKIGFDSYLNGAGLLVWHIDGTTVSNLLPSNSVNNNECKSVAPGACANSASHFGVALLQADNLLQLENNSNRGDASDPFNSPKTLTDSTVPHSKFWSGTPSWMNISSISASSATMTATLSMITGLVNGSCGSSNNQAVISIPATNLCSAGTASTISGIGPWFWSCSGSNGGTASSCMAYSTSQQGTIAPFPQKFDGVAPSVLPSGWSSAVSSGSGGIWRTNAGTVHPSGVAAHSANNLVYFNSWTAIAESAAYLASQAFSLAGKVGGKVSLWMYHDVQYNDYADRIDVYVNSASNLAGANLIGTVNRYDGTIGWSQHTFDIPNIFAGATNYLLINGVSDFGNDMHLDDINVYAFTPLYPLTYAFAGTGYGSVNSAPSGIFCTGTAGSACNTTNFSGGASVLLSASADSSSAYNSVFTGWTTNTTACPGNGSCSVALNNPVTVTGTFTRDKLVKFSTQGSGTYGTIFEAHGSATDGQIIQVRDNSGLTPFDDVLTIDKGITLIGGFDSGFASSTGYTATKGRLTVVLKEGHVVRLQKIIVKQ